MATKLIKNRRLRFSLLTIFILACVYIFSGCAVAENGKPTNVNGNGFNNSTFSTQKNGNWKELSDNRWEFVDNNGTAVNGWNQIDGIWYCFDSNGILITDQVVGKYYVNASGASIDLHLKLTQGETARKLAYNKVIYIEPMYTIKHRKIRHSKV